MCILAAPACTEKRLSAKITDQFSFIVRFETGNPKLFPQLEMCDTRF